MLAPQRIAGGIQRRAVETVIAPIDTSSILTRVAEGPGADALDVFGPRVDFLTVAEDGEN